MAILPTRVDRGSDAFRQNREGMLSKLAELDEQIALACAGGGAKYLKRHHERGKLLPRERVELLLDRDAPFLELSPLAASGTDYVVGASVVTGIGVVSDVECVVIAHDPTVRGGATNPFGLKKALRAMVRPVKEIATAIEEQDAKTLSALPGIGPATSERIIAKLRRKVPKFALMVTREEAREAEVEPDVVSQTFEILCGLGHTSSDARRLLDAALAAKKKHADVQSLLQAIYQQSHPE